MSLAVVHLVRAGNPAQALEGFLDAYRRHDAGAAHRLVLLLKGFDGRERELATARAAAGDLASDQIHVSDAGFDLRAYFEVVHRASDESLCFVNSFARPQSDGWLAALHEAANAPGVGLAGATGSWASVRAHVLFYLAGVGPYAEVFDDRVGYREQFDMLTPRAGQSDATRPIHPLLRRYRFLHHVQRQLRRFGSFPAPHVRTNAFLARRDVLARVRTGRLDTKEQHYELESGRSGLTAQIAGMGLRTVLCGLDGLVRDPADWPNGDTFWQAGQANLLVADNQTEAYARGDDELRALLSGFAWGRLARPAPNDASS